MKAKNDHRLSVAPLEPLSGEELSAVSGARASISDLHIVKVVDKASPSLFTTCATGQHIPEAKLAL